MTPSELIIRQFPNRLSLTLPEAGAALSLAAGTSYNMHSKGVFPVRVHKIGTKLIVYLHDLLSYIEGEPSATDTQIEAPALPKKIGRPTKAEAKRRAQLV